MDIDRKNWFMRKGGRWGQCEIRKNGRDGEWWKNEEKGKGR
jgi:hypothetical protein